MMIPRVSLPGSILGLLVVSFSLQVAPAVAEPTRLRLHIDGTRLRKGPSGLPSELEGVVFYADGPSGGSIAGTYHETVRPHVDPRLGFVGARGRSTFRLFGRQRDRTVVDQIVTENRSAIVGELPATQTLLVESVGTVVESNGSFEGLTGTMQTAAEIRLVGDFSLSVDLTIFLRPRGASSGVQPAGDLAGGVSGPSPWSALAGSRSSRARSDGDRLEIRLLEDGRVALLYRPQFRAAITDRVLGGKGREPAALDEVARQCGLSAELLTRWVAEAKLLRTVAGDGGPLAFLRRLQGRTVEEKLRIVVEASELRAEALEEFLREKGVQLAEFQEWRDRTREALGVRRTPQAEPRPAASSGDARPVPATRPSDTDTEPAPESAADDAGKDDSSDSPNVLRDLAEKLRKLRESDKRADGEAGGS